jgi:hypothetical protein
MAWIKNFDWEALHSEQMTAPYIPLAQDNFSTRIVNEAFKDEEDVKFKES